MRVEMVTNMYVRNGISDFCAITYSIDSSPKKPNMVQPLHTYCFARRQCRANLEGMS